MADWVALDRRSTNETLLSPRIHDQPDDHAVHRREQGSPRDAGGRPHERGASIAAYGLLTIQPFTPIGVQIDCLSDIF